MKKITISEWKCLYPIKKCIFILTEGFFMFFSENWICIQNHYIPRDGIIEMWLKCETGATDRVYDLGFLPFTGEIYQKRLLSYLKLLR